MTLLENGQRDRGDWPRQWDWLYAAPARDDGVEPYDHAVRKAINQTQRIHYTADGRMIAQGQWYWNNNLECVRVTVVAAHIEGIPGQGPYGEVAWHATTGGSFDGSRLAKFWEGREAGEGVTP